MKIMRFLALALAFLCVLIVGAQAQGTWGAVQSISVPKMTNGHMFYQVLTLNYTGTGTKSPVLIYEHENSEGDKCYPNNPSACAGLTAPLASGGSGVNDWFNNATFQSRYCAVGCIIISVAADQTSDPSGATSNFGGYGDSAANPDPNELGVIAVLQHVEATMNADPNRAYCTGDSLGGIGCQALGLDCGVKTGTNCQLIAATMPFSGAVYRGGLNAPTNAQVAQIQGGGTQFNVNGSGDTGTSSNPTLWAEPLWDAVAGPSKGLTPPAPAAAAGFTTLTYGPNIVVAPLDVNNTPQMGVNGSNWAQFTFFGNEAQLETYTANADGSVTITGSGNAYGGSLSSAVFSNSAAPYFIGQSFGGGGYFQVVAKTTATNKGMAFWANDMENMAAGSAGIYGASWPQQSSPKFPSFSDWVENDMMEFDNPNRYGFSLHNWSGVTGSGTSYCGNTYNASCNGYYDVAGNWGGPVGVVDSNNNWTPPPGVDYTQYNTYGFLWVPATATTAGYGKYYFNGNQVGNTIYWNQYNPALAPTPHAGNVTTIGNSAYPCNYTIPAGSSCYGGTIGQTAADSAWSILDQKHMILILGGLPATFQSVQVWQKDGTGDIPVINTGVGKYPGPPAGGRASTSPLHFLLDTNLGHDVWDTYRIFPAAEPMLDVLFGSSAGATGVSGGPGLTGTAKSVLPPGYLSVVGNQVQDGNGNNVRLACTGYDQPTSNVSADMASMRAQGFNCARVPFYDKDTCPGGTCSFTTLDSIVSAATNNSMRVILDHHGNETKTACTGGLQANGLWYDQNATSAPWNITNNTDGCGNAGTVSYAQFRSNWIALATHYKGNNTVIGFDLHNEPTTYGNPTCCAGAAGGTGNFVVKNGKIMDPGGNVFIPHGINLDSTELQYAVTNASAQPLTQLFPNINYVRAPVRTTSGIGTASAVYPAVNAYDSFIANATANHIVVELEDHDCNGGYWENFISGGVPQNTPCTPPTGGALQTMLNYWTAVAAHYANNPYVWIGSLNEINSLDGTYAQASIAAVYTYESQLYNAIRAVSPHVMIDMGNGIGGGNDGTVGINGPGTSPLASAPLRIIPGVTYWGTNGHYDQGEPYVTQIPIAQQITDIQNIFGSVPNTVIYRGGYSDEGGVGKNFDAQIQQVQAAGIIAPYVVNTFAINNGFSPSTESNAYTTCYNNAKSAITANPHATVFEIGNEWDLQGGWVNGSNANLASAARAQTTIYPLMRGCMAGSVRSIRDNAAPGTQILGGANGGFNHYGLLLAMGQDLASYTVPGGSSASNDMWDFSVVHWYRDFNAGGGDMGNPTNFDGGLNMMADVATLGVPLMSTEFGSGSDRSTGGDNGAANNLTTLMGEFVGGPGFAGGQQYKLYTSTAEPDYLLYTYDTSTSPATRTITPQGTALKNYIAAHPPTPTTQTVVGAWHNIQWYMHRYYTDGTTSGALAAVQGSSAACCGGSGGSGYIGSQTLQSGDGVVPLTFNECGSGTGNSGNGDASSIVAAMTQIQPNGYGTACWAWFPSAQWQMVNNGDTAGGPFSLTTWGTQISNMIKSFPATGGQGSAIGASWASGTGGDIKAMVEDVGLAVETADPGALIIVEGPLNNGTLFNGTTRGSANLPITAGAIADLSTIGTTPVACCTGHVVYSIHDLPTSLSSVAPDSGTAASTMRNTAWGYLETNNTAPVWVGKLGASLDNSNGQQSDENGWATGLTQYMNGQLANQGGPAFTGCQQPMGGDWWDWGNNASLNPNGTLNPDGTNKTGQAGFWSTLLYTTCNTQINGGGGGGGGGQATVWNPNDAAAGITLSNGQLTATTTATGSNSVRTTTSLTTGKFCEEITATNISANWDVGIANAAFNLTVGGGLGVDTNGIGFDPNSGGGLQGVFYGNAVLSSGSVSSAAGDKATICEDLTNKLLWVTTTAMRTEAGVTWNNSTTANPATGTGGLSFSGTACPCFITWNEDEAGAATLNAVGPFAVATPAGFAPWQAPITSQGGRPIVIILGKNEHFPWDDYPSTPPTIH